jgi:hypothetical protein
MADIQQAGDEIKQAFHELNQSVGSLVLYYMRNRGRANIDDCNNFEKLIRNRVEILKYR